MYNGESGANGMCNCPHCKGGMGMGGTDWRMMRAVRVLTAVIVTIFVFWCGVQVGEVKATLDMGGGYGMMQMGHSFTTARYDAAPATMMTGTSAPAAGAGTVTAQGQTTNAQ